MGRTNYEGKIFEMLMVIWICTDMEGLAGVDYWDQCYDPYDTSTKYQYGREQLRAVRRGECPVVLRESVSDDGITGSGRAGPVIWHLHTMNARNRQQLCFETIPRSLSLRNY